MTKIKKSQLEDKIYSYESIIDVFDEEYLQIVSKSQDFDVFKEKGSDYPSRKMKFHKISYV